MPGAEEDQVVLGLRDQRPPPEEEGAQQDLAQLGIALHDRANAVAVQGDDRPLGDHAGAGQRDSRREHVDLARELPRPEYRDGFFPAGDWAHDLDPPADHDEEVAIPVAGLEQELPDPDAAVLAHVRDARDLGIGEAGVHLLAAFHPTSVDTIPRAPAQVRFARANRATTANAAPGDSEGR